MTRAGGRHRVERSRPGAARRRAIAAALAIGMVLGATWNASAFWAVQSDAGSNGAAAATGVNQGATPVVSATGQSVSVSWAATTLTGGQAVSGYRVRRYDATTLAAQTMLTACNGTLVAIGCTENSVPAGTWVYTVTPVFATNWQGGESARSSAVTIETTPPVNAISLSSVSGGAFKSTNTVYYRGVAAGSFTLTNALTDAGSGPAASATAAFGGVSTGWNHSPSTVSAPAGGPYVSNMFSWNAGTTSSPTEAVTGRDVVGNTAATTLTFTNDSTVPTAGSITYSAGYVTSRSVSITLGASSDGLSGLGTRRIQRASAPLTAGSCGTYSGFASVGTVNPSSPFTDTNVANATCYKYQYVVYDNVGNQAIATSANIVKVDYATAVSTTSGLLSQYRLDETASPFAADSFTGPADTDFTGHVADVGGVWTNLAGGTSHVFFSNNNRFRGDGQGRSLNYVAVAPPSADYAVEADLYVASNLAGDKAGVVGRLDTSNKDAYVARYEVANTSWDIIKYDDTNKTNPIRVATLTGQTLTVGSTYRVRLEVSGSASTVLKLYVNGVQKLTYTDSSSPYTAAGNVGILDGDYNQGNIGKDDTHGMHFDNFDAYYLANDSKGTNEGGYLNGVTLGAAGAIYGDPDTAAQFDGGNDYVNITRQVSTDFSAEFWFNSTGGTGTSSNWYSGAALIDNTASTTRSAQADWGVSLRSDGKIVAGVGGGTDVSVVSSSGGYNDGTWHHVVFTRTAASGAMVLYVDGAQAATGTGATSARTAVGSITFGRSQPGANGFAGYLDEVALYGAALSSTTVNDHYLLGTAPSAVNGVGPTGGSVDATGLSGTGSRYSRSTTLNLALDKGSDTDGLATSGNQLMRATAPLTSAGGTASGTCGSYGTYSFVALDPATPDADTVNDQACYRYQYVVADSLGNTTTYTSPDIQVDSTSPIAPALAFSSFTNTYWSGTGGTVFYRSAAGSGGFVATATTTDAASGVASYAFPALGTKWTGTPGSLGVTTYSWTGGVPAAPGSPTVTATNNAGGTSTATAFTMTADDTPPTTGTISYTNGNTTSMSLAVTFAAGTDTGGSGIGTRYLQRATASMTGGTCGSFSSFATVSGGTNPSSPYIDSVYGGTCYKYQYLVYDNVGNAATAATSASVTKVTTTYQDTVLGTPGLVNYYRLGESATGVDSFTGTAGTLLSSHTPEAGGGWTKWQQDNATVVLSDANRARRNGVGGISYLATATPSSPDYQVTADVYVKSLIDEDDAGVVGRFDTGNTNGSGTRYIARYSEPNGYWELRKDVNGSGALLGSWSDTPNVGQTYSVTLDMKGSTIRMLVDGVERVSVTDTSITAAGRGGIRLGSGGTGASPTNSTGMHLDNFQMSLQPADSAGTNKGTYLDGTSLGAAGAITHDSDTAAQFDGTNDFVSVNSQVTNDFSAEFWFKSTQGTGTGPDWFSGAALVDNSSQFANRNDWGVSLRSDGKVVAGVGNPDTSIISASGGYNDGAWHHVVFTRSSSSGAMVLYVDGGQVASGTGATAARTAVPVITFGRRADPGGGTGKPYAGYLDEVAIYNTVLSAAAVLGHHNAGLS